FFSFFSSSFSSSLYPPHLTPIKWSNVIHFTNRYPVVAYQIWSVCYTPNIPQATETEADSCDALYQFSWFLSFIPTRIAITGVQSSSGVMTYISLAAFDILATSLVTNRMMQAIRGCGGFRKVARQNLSEYAVVTTPQIIAVVLYFVGVLLVSQEYQAILILHPTGSTGMDKIVFYYLRTKARLISFW
ncbi:uncharacterized protein C8R40DRAFT_1084800, partial [Lentinula edodes]|uniref:uncharacterized protein n=1 Tax=Lentinula edodes TaxID=5353 RepID=UPI001E8D5F99